MPMLARATIRAITAMVTNSTLRISGSMVRARVLPRLRPLTPRLCCTAVSVRIHTSQAASRVVPKLSTFMLICSPSPSA
ncbi:hypothetical protein D3C72_2392490 [compost metagenome]